MDRTTHKLWTYADLEHTPEDGNRYEIFDGELVVTPSPSHEHQWSVGELYVEFRRQLMETDLALVLLSPVDVLLSSTRVVVPDLVVIRNQRLDLLWSERVIRGAPDLVIEILSPSSIKTDRERKLRLYARVGIPEYWIVDPQNRTIEVYALGNQEYCLDAAYAANDRLISVTFALELDVGSIFFRRRP